MDKLKQFYDYKKLLNEYRQKLNDKNKITKDIQENKKQISHAENIISNIQSSRSPEQIFSNNNISQFKNIDAHLYSELSSFYDEYSEIKKTEQSDILEARKKEQNDIDALNIEQDKIKKYIDYLLNKTHTNLIELLTVESIEKWLEAEPDSVINNFDLTFAKNDFEDHIHNIKDPEDIYLDEYENIHNYLNYHSNASQIRNQLDHLDSLNMLDKNFWSSINNSDCVDYSDYKLDDIIEKINQTPSFETDVYHYPKWAQFLANALLPALIFIFGASIVLLIPGISQFISAIIVSIGSLILQVIIPVFVGSMLYTLFYDHFLFSTIKSVIFSILGAALSWWIISLFDISVTILMIPIMLILLIGVAFLAYKANDALVFPDKILQFLDEKQLLFVGKRKEINKLINKNVDSIYLALSINDISHHFAQQNTDSILTLNTQKQLELENKVSQAEKEVKNQIHEEAIKQLENALAKQDYLNNLSSRINHVKSKYMNEINKIESSTISKLIKLMDRLRGNYDNYISIVRNFIESKHKKVENLNEHKKDLTQSISNILEELRPLGEGLFTNNVNGYEVKGQFPDRLFIQNHDKRNKDEQNLVDFTPLTHHQLPIVFLYDFDSDQNLSEKLFNFIQILIEASFSIYPLDLIRFIITDVQNHAINFKRLEEQGILEIISDVPTLASTINNSMLQISSITNTIDDYNQMQEMKYGRTATYKKQIINFFFVPDLTKIQSNQRISNDDFWRVVNNGSKLGYLPIFFIKKDNWTDETLTNKDSFINHLQSFYDGKKSNIYELDNNNNFQPL